MLGGAVILAVLKTGNDNAVNTDVVVVIVKRSHLKPLLQKIHVEYKNALTQ